MNFTGQHTHEGRVKAYLGGTGVGHYYTTTYDDYHSYSEATIGGLTGLCYRPAGTGNTLTFKLVAAPHDLTLCEVRSFTL